ncbi:MAG TPA: hypothetical protein P5246_02400, partial [Candidatus Omnitrophota bacterium]|nr:hypothetical protein [Candidatus Omnitrophota bacterium]
MFAMKEGIKKFKDAFLYNIVKFDDIIQKSILSNSVGKVALGSIIGTGVAAAGGYGINSIFNNDSLDSRGYVASVGTLALAGLALYGAKKIPAPVLQNIKTRAVNVTKPLVAIAKENPKAARYVAVGAGAAGLSAYAEYQSYNQYMAKQKSLKPGESTSYTGYGRPTLAIASAFAAVLGGRKMSRFLAANPEALLISIYQTGVDARYDQNPAESSLLTNVFRSIVLSPGRAIVGSMAGEGGRKFLARRTYLEQEAIFESAQNNLGSLGAAGLSFATAYTRALFTWGTGAYQASAVLSPLDTIKEFADMSRKPKNIPQNTQEEFKLAHLAWMAGSIMGVKPGVKAANVNLKGLLPPGGLRQVLRRTNAAMPSWVFVNSAINIFAPSIFGEGTDEMPDRIKSTAYQSDNVARGAFGAALLYNAVLSPIVKGVSARYTRATQNWSTTTQTMVGGGLTVSGVAMHVLGTQWKARLESEYELLKAEEVALAKIKNRAPDFSKIPKKGVFANILANSGLLVQSVGTSILLKRLHPNTWTKDFKSYTNRQGTFFVGGETSLTARVTDRLFVRPGAFLTGTSLGVLSAASAVYGSKKLVVDHVISAFQARQNNEAEGGFLSHFAANYLEKSTPYLLRGREYSINKAVDLVAMAKALKVLDKDATFDEKQTIKDKTYSKMTNEALKEEAKALGMSETEVDKKLQANDRDAIVWAVIKGKVDRAMESYKVAGKDNEYSFNGELFSKNRDENYERRVGGYGTDLPIYLLEGLMVAATVKGIKEYRSKFAELKRNNDSVKGVSKGLDDYFAESGKLRQATDKFGQEHAFGTAAAWAGAGGVLWGGGELLERAGQGQKNQTMQEWGRAIQVLGKTGVAIGGAVALGGFGDRILQSSKLSFAGKMNSGAIMVGKMTAETASNLAFVMAPLSGVLEGVSWAANKAVPLAGSDMEKNFLKYTVAGFWDDTQVLAKDGKTWIDRGAVKYQGATSIFGVMGRAYSSGLFGYDVATGELKVASLSDIPTTPQKLLPLPESMGGSPTEEYKGLQGQMIGFSAGLTALRWMTPVLNNIKYADFGRRFQAMNHSFDKTFDIDLFKSNSKVGKMFERFPLHPSRMISGSIEEIGEQFAQIGLQMTPVGYVGPILRQFGVSPTAARSFSEQFNEIVQEIVLSGSKIGVKNSRYANQQVLQFLSNNAGRFSGSQGLENLKAGLRDAASADQLGDIRADEVDYVIENYEEIGFVDSYGVTMPARMVLAATNGIGADARGYGAEQARQALANFKALITQDIELQIDEQNRSVEQVANVLEAQAQQKGQSFNRQEFLASARSSGRLITSEKRAKILESYTKSLEALEKKDDLTVL